MNKRIRQLAEQVVGPSRLFGGDFALMGNEQVEKFAALIIEECAKVCNKIDSEYDGEDVLATWCAKEIKQHFGV
jgi:hypothetical protein